MLQRIDLQIIIRALIPLFVIPLLGIAPRPHELQHSLQNVQPAGGAGAAGRSAASLAQIVEYQPWRVDLWQVAGAYAVQAGDPQAAVTYYERGNRVDALTPINTLYLGDAYQQQGEEQAALQAWEMALQAGADPVEVYHRYLAVHRRQDNSQEVTADLQALATLRPADVQLRYTLGLYLAAQQPQEALPHLAQAADLDPSLKPRADALASSIRAASRSDDPAYTLLEAGRALAAVGEWARAAEAFQRSVDQRPQFAEAWAYLGEARQHLPLEEGGADPETGMVELQKSLEIDPDSLVANTLLALYWQRHGRFDEARDVLQRVSGIYPENPALLAELGNLLAQDGEMEVALSAYQAAVELEPRQADYWRLLAGFSASYEYLLGEVGLPAARRAAALDPDNPANLDMLGQVLLLLQDFASAERTFQRAVQVDAGYAPGHVHLGLIYILRDERIQAREKWTYVLELAPGTPAADQAKRLMDNYFP